MLLLCFVACIKQPAVEEKRRAQSRHEEEYIRHCSQEARLRASASAAIRLERFETARTWGELMNGAS
jgi:hypothetical protein